MNQKKFFMMQFIFLFLLTFISANLTNIDLGLNYTDSRDYAKSIEMLKDNCSSLYYDDYHLAQCHFILCYDYYMLWQESKIIIDIDNDSYYVGSKKDLFLLNNSIENCLKATNLSWSNLTYDELIKNTKSSFLISSLSFLINDYLILGDYYNAEKFIESFNSIRLSGIVKDEHKPFIDSIYNKFYSALPKKVEIKLVGNINPLSFSQPEIKPHIVLTSDNDPYFEILHMEYFNLRGFQKYDIIKENFSFNFDQKIILNKKNILLYPFDSYYAEIFNIRPGRIRNETLEISITGEDSNLNGIAFFNNDSITLSFSRKIGYKLKIIGSFFILIMGLIFLNKNIKNMKTKSFKFKKLVNEWSFYVTISSLVIFITFGLREIKNILSFIILVLLIFTIYHFFKKKIHLHNKK